MCPFCSLCIHMACQAQPSLNCPEENDETLSDDFQYRLLPESLPPETSHIHSLTLSSMLEQHNPYSGRKLFQSHPFSSYTPLTPYPSHANVDRRVHDGMHYPSYLSRSSGSGFSGCQPNSLPSYLPSTDYQSYFMDGCCSPSGQRFFTSKHSVSLSSLEKPGSLHSFTSCRPPINTDNMLPHSGHAPYIQYGLVPGQTSIENDLIPRTEYHQSCTLTGM